MDYNSLPVRIESPRRLVSVTLLGTVLFLLLANCIGILSSLYFGRTHVFGLVPLFNFDRESNIPTLYSILALLFAGFLLWLIATGHRRRNEPSKYWVLLAVLFVFLALDEAAGIHEEVGPLFLRIMDNLSIEVPDWILRFYAWIIPYSVLVLLVAGICIRFLLHLPRHHALLFIAAGTVYITGAAGFEILGGLTADSVGRQTFRYALFYTLEELLEMLGVVLFINALLGYMAETFHEISLVFRG